MINNLGSSIPKYETMEEYFPFGRIKPNSQNKNKVETRPSRKGPMKQNFPFVLIICRPKIPEFHGGKNSLFLSFLPEVAKFLVEWKAPLIYSQHVASVVFIALTKAQTDRQTSVPLLSRLACWTRWSLFSFLSISPICSIFTRKARFSLRTGHYCCFTLASFFAFGTLRTW